MKRVIRIGKIIIKVIIKYVGNVSKYGKFLLSIFFIIVIVEWLIVLFRFYCIVMCFVLKIFIN